MNLQEAKTIHRLLGIGNEGTPTYNGNNQLSEDVIIVDEASMLGVELANFLFSAVKSGARLILLGDAQQLSAVEAGAVLGDLCQLPQLTSMHADLVDSTRFNADSAVGQLATLINNPPVNSVVDTTVDSNVSSNVALRRELITIFEKYSALTLTDISQYNNKYQRYYIYQQLISFYQPYIQQTLVLQTQFQSTDDINITNVMTALLPLMKTFNQFRILTVGHAGFFGDETINEVLTQAHRKFLQLSISQFAWYHGRPVMVRKNNYGLGLFNGDIGICVQLANADMVVYFESKETPIAVNRLGNLEVVTAYAMTVHKSQGSEFNHVAVMVDEAIHKLLTREMLYTAVTRAKSHISMFGTVETLMYAIKTPTRRLTGLGLNHTMFTS